MTREWVVDASVGIKLFVPEELSEKAEQVFSQLEDVPPVRLYVPDLFYIECTNILWKYVRRFGYQAEKAQESIAKLSALALHPIASSQLVSSALDLALAREITAYDACYATLARWLGISLLSADEKLIRKLKGSEVPVRWLGDL